MTQMTTLMTSLDCVVPQGAPLATFAPGRCRFCLYEQLKALTRGKAIGAQELAAFVDQLSIPEDAKARLRALTPAGYIGKAIDLARRI